MTGTTNSDARYAVELPQTGPSFAAALLGFLSTTVATTMLLFLLGNL